MTSLILHHKEQEICDFANIVRNSIKMSSKKDKNKQFEKFCEAFKKAHPSLVKNLAHKEAMKQWNDLKKLKNPETAISEKMQEYRLKEARQDRWTTFEQETKPKKQTWKNLEIDSQNPYSNFLKAHPLQSML